jgi:hypothetical protein
MPFADAKLPFMEKSEIKSAKWTSLLENNGSELHASQSTRDGDVGYIIPSCMCTPVASLGLFEL